MIVTAMSVLIFIVMVCLYMYWQAHRNRCLHSTCFIDGLPKPFDGTTLFFISDIHKRTLSKNWIDTLPRCDFVFIGGDLTEAGVKKHKVEENVHQLCRLGKSVYFVWGNNDHEWGEGSLSKLLHKYGVHELNNCSVEHVKQGEKLTIAGVDDLGYYRTDIHAALNSTDLPLIFLAHNPEVIYYRDLPYKCDLLLCGHTHGGQVRLFGLGVTEKGGWKKIGGKCHMLVSNGYGTTRIPFRLGAPPETHVITLRSGSNVSSK
ncbi:metallophosphoesterase [Texcoconibacillus texcoconensis]|uniref:Putative MPP superfamily phosphohydrolase n=1 Tax=Texcoconibacillus texcoconensis TaxID=1095777 RepID=A0A840QNK8_9BACI|nr:metallophosphoesterase [Texcoconibacillus texcoconensis]MBB5172923.1 putative MPP superfamily phosphohydrolase [Texcoconibacillus texcoconensis]